MYGDRMKQVRRKVMTQKDSFYEDLEQVFFIIFLVPYENSITYLLTYLLT